MTTRPEFVLLDGHAVAYRQFFALPVGSFSTRAGEPTNATYGFTRILLDLIQKEKPQYLAVSFDMGMSGRDALYHEYKGTREKMPDDLRVQLDRIDQVVRAFNIPVLKLDDYEADDVIGTVVRQASSWDITIRIITGDRDILQLLRDNVRVQLPSRNGPDEIYDVARFIEKYGLQPHQLIDLKALMGDNSDNIPGVKGIGEKTATSLLQTYGSLEEIYQHIDEIKGANRQKLLDGKDMAFLSQKLATIRTDVPITLDLKACITQDFDVRAVDDLFAELDFRSLRDRLGINDALQLPLFSPHMSTETPQIIENIVPTITVQTETDLTELVQRLNSAQAITFDTETTGTDPISCELVGIALAVDDQAGYYIPVGHKEGTQLPLQIVVDAIRPALTNPAIPKYAHNATYDLVVMRRYGIDVKPIAFDTMIAEWVNDPISRFLGLKALVRDRLKIHMTDIDELIGKGTKQITMDKVAIASAAPYAAADAALTHRLVEVLTDSLRQRQSLDLFHSLEIPLIPVIADMEQAGVALDIPFLREMSKKLATQLQVLENEIFALSSGYGRFNINSPKQLNDVLFGKLGLPVQGLKKTTHGHSTDVVTLEALRDAHPIIPLILDYRELAKLKSTYVDALPELVNPYTGRVHTSYNQTGTSTGRFSSSNPNLQNIPIRTEIGREVRRAFIAPAGYTLLSVDYSQVELRVMAHISGDETLIEAFRQGMDIHRATAAAVNGIKPEDVTYEQRSFAKRVNFGLMYGMGAFRLARDSELTLAEAEAFINTYFQRFPRVRDYIERTKEQARQQGYVETLFGRRRYFPALQRGDKGQTALAEERAAINMPIQGTAADILKRAMINLHHELRQYQPDARMILQVHDELVLEVPEDALEDTCRRVVHIMESAAELKAPLQANAQAGPNWRDMYEIRHAQ